jgi:hypothetical protein
MLMNIIKTNQISRLEIKFGFDNKTSRQLNHWKNWTTKDLAIRHRETNQHGGIPTQASRFHENSPHVSCFIVETLPCFYHSKENT